jgi:hypothetical protein
MLPLLRRGRRIFQGGNVVARVALDAAYSAASDEVAAQRLRDEAASRPADARAALKLYAQRRDRFDMDRAYRLLAAAVSGEAVQAIPSDRRGLFDRERHLGRMPLSEAFAVLADREPRLRKLAAAASSKARSTSPTTSPDDDTETSTSWRAPPDAKAQDDPLYQSELARAIATQYLAILDGSHDGDASSSYFALPRKNVVLTTHFRQP